MQPSTRTFNHFFPPDVRQRVISLLYKGNTLRTACKTQRLNEATLVKLFKMVSEWVTDPAFHIDDYSDEEKLVISFYLDVQAALSQAETISVEIVHSAAKGGDWKAAQWMLKQRNPEEWGQESASTTRRQPGTELVPVDNQTLLANPNLDLRRLDSKELQLLEELITKASSPAPEAIEVAPSAPRRLSG